MITEPGHIHPGYRQAFLDWMACAYAGRNQPAVAAITGEDGAFARVMRLATSGHILDFDDTYGPGLAHISAPTAPAALIVGADRGASIGSVLVAYAAGFEAMAAVARASHPDLYERGWHPTAVIGAVGAATAAASLLELDYSQTRTAQDLALLGAGGLQAAFGTDGKSLQVGMAAARGVQAAQLAARGASVGSNIRRGFETVYGGRWADPDDALAIEENWIKAFPCCLQTHSSIEAAERMGKLADRESGGSIVVHPRSRQAAPLDDVTTGLEAKFSIPYTVAFTLLYGAPSVEDFEGVDESARELAAGMKVELDDHLGESEAVLTCRVAQKEVVTRVEAARGSPIKPMTDVQLAEKIRLLSGTILLGVLDDRDHPSAEVLRLLEAP